MSLSFIDMADVATYNIHYSSPEKPQKRRRLNRKAMEQELREQEMREEAMQRQEASRSMALEYLEEFLDNSEWSERRDYISIIYDAVPTMEELVSFGGLDEKEGTRACRRMFKAVVIWDELGHNLWEVLNASSDTRRPSIDDAAAADTVAADFDTASTIVPSRRTSEDSSLSSRASFWSTPSRSSSTSEKQPRRKWYSRPSTPVSRRSSVASSESKHLCECCAARCQPSELATLSEPQVYETPRSTSSTSFKSTLPKIISENCASALRRTWGRLSDRTMSTHGRIYNY
ncbi:hypothetical protein PT974_01799 [Cladobotryum mycophilum]|uniref:Uncharacterized protein n=1 Tax=Cladobotryum mycophilum TaxID=491253 RepID=A0ABR0SXF1_9HYPO